MSFWSTLGKIALPVASIAAAPFTAGTSLLGMAGMGAKAAGAIGAGAGALSKIGQASGPVGATASGLAAGMTSERAAANKAAQAAQDFKLRESQGHETDLENRAGLDLKQRQFGQDSQNNAYKNAMRSAVAKNIQDIHFGPTPSGVKQLEITGGLRPSAMGPEGRAAAAMMNDKAMASLMNGEKFDPLPQLERTAAPVYKESSAGENILGGIGTGMTALHAGMTDASNKTFEQQLMDKINGIINQPNAAGVVPPAQAPKPAPGIQPWQPIPQATMADPYAGDADASNRG